MNLDILSAMENVPSPRSHFLDQASDGEVLRSDKLELLRAHYTDIPIRQPPLCATPASTSSTSSSHRNETTSAQVSISPLQKPAPDELRDASPTPIMQEISAAVTTNTQKPRRNSCRQPKSDQRAARTLGNPCPPPAPWQVQRRYGRVAMNQVKLETQRAKTREVAAGMEGLSPDTVEYKELERRLTSLSESKVVEPSRKRPRRERKTKRCERKARRRAVRVRNLRPVRNRRADSLLVLVEVRAPGLVPRKPRTVKNS
ncbi:hypothetical protein BJ875DRAFT_440349 [Amylocarpus encephaloides]|uniref:Uncharacterized protein n=1 Tax=Amylocarpus encephaloides TaxID=45428 RepID=A0A9P7YLX5_9HELO|nr:hypothetical protein BJ875DRAFT_440349 [Amylocarpus encephaloides]